MHYNVFADAVRNARKRKQETGEEQYVTMEIGKERYEGPYNVKEVDKIISQSGNVCVVFSTLWEHVLHDWK